MDVLTKCGNCGCHGLQDVVTSAAWQYLLPPQA
jgi:hypothetical protein